MRQLFGFIWKHYFFFLFLLLEIIAFSLIINHNNFQRAAFINSTNQFTGSILNTFNNISEYFSLKKANILLADENALFHSSSENSFIKTDSNSFFKDDTLYKHQYLYVAAKVISNSTNKRNNYIMLNKGRKHGIEKDMGVFTSDGVIGTVIEVSENFSRVMSILHKKYKLNAKIKKNGHLGTIEWDGLNYKIGTLRDIPTHVKLYKHDTVITSGNSYIFPEGILIGTVNEYIADHNDKFNKVSIIYSIDYNKLYYVYIIKNLLKKEQIQLEESTNDK